MAPTAKPTVTSAGGQTRQRGPFTPRSREGTLIGDRYSLERLIRFDDVASVYLSRDLTLNRVVAVKVLHTGALGDPLLVEHFIEMERRLAALFHPHLVTVFDAAASDGLCWSAREYCGAGSLRQRLPSRQPIPVWQVTSLLYQIGSALETAHRAGLFHGRLAPNHVLFDDTGTAKLNGFDHASAPGIPAAAHPGDEVRVSPGPTGPLSDQHALAAMAVELLTGRWRSDDDRGERRQDFGDVALVRMRNARADIPRRLDEVLSQALSTDPNQRFPSMGAFLAAVAQSGVSEPVAHRSGSPLGAPVSDSETVLPSAFADDELDEQPRSLARLGRRSSGWLDRLPARGSMSDSNTAQRARAWRDRALGGAGAATSAGRDRIRRAGAHLHRRLERWRLWPPRPDLAAAWLRRREPIEQLVMGAGAVALLLIAVLILPRAFNPPIPVSTPQLAGGTVDSARAAVKAAGLDLRVSQEVSESAPRGTVLRQEPPAGDPIRPGQRVRVVVSSGLPPTTVPNLTHRRLDDARTALAAVGLTSGAIYEFETSQHPWGTVVRQTAVAGHKIPRGDAVDVFVAVPPWTDVPSVTNHAVGDAENELKGKGLRLGEVRLEAAGGRQAGTVLGQEPAPGVRLREGSTVSVAIAVPNPAESAPNR